MLAGLLGVPVPAAPDSALVPRDASADAPRAVPRLASPTAAAR
jgi:hypothetical protein